MLLNIVKWRETINLVRSIVFFYGSKSPSSIVDDPLDIKYVTISASKLSDVTGHGAFAKTYIPGNTPYAVYSGQIFNNGDERKELINMQHSKIKQFMINEENSSKVIRYAESLNKFRCQPKL